MSVFQLLSLPLLCLFYIVYILKMLALKRRGINGQLLGKGDKPKAARIVEICLRVVTGGGAAIQFGSTLFPDVIWSVPAPLAVRVMGLVLMLCGNLCFIAAAMTMRDNWRAGFDRHQSTSLVTRGIYNRSRNPAFVGFDLLYIGCAAVFPNVVHLGVGLVAVILFHAQIHGEESYLAETFGMEYTQYSARVRRYL